MEELSARMGRGEAGVVFLFRTNPVFSLPPRLAFKENLKKASLTVGMGEFLDETVREADLVLPLSHSLESWGDVEPRRGVVSLLQPVLPPLHDTLSDGDVLLRLLGNGSGKAAAGSYEELLRAAWGKRLGEAGRNRLLEKGYVEETLPKKTVSLDGKRAASALRDAGPAEDAGKPVLVLAPSLRTFDGRSRILPILSEIPDPLTTITYGPWISVSEEDAARAGVRDRDEVTVAAGDWKAVLPVKVQPGLAAGVFVVYRDMLPSPPVRTDRRTGGEVDVHRRRRDLEDRKNGPRCPSSRAPSPSRDAASSPTPSTWRRSAAINGGPCTPSTSTRSTGGRWPWTLNGATAAPPAWRPATSRTTCPLRERRTT